MDPRSEPPFADPYVSPQAPPKPSAPSRELQYLRAWQYVFDSSQWALNLLFGVIAMIVPVIGPILVNGYQFEVLEGLHRSGGRTYPDFNLERFADYLVRGVWVFLVALLASLVLAPFFLALYFGGFLAMALAASAAGDEEAAGVVFAVGTPLLILAIVVLASPLAVLLNPVMIRAGLAQDFATALNFDWIKSFISKTWKEMLVGTLFVAITGALATMVGLLLCCVGTYPAAVLAMLAQAHLNYQYYELFLQRGGEPIPLKSDTTQGW